MDNKKIELAYERIDRERKFYRHLAVYLLVFSLLGLLNLWQGGVWTFNSAMILWGIGLGAHASSVFLGDYLLGKRWEERRLKQLLEE